MRLIDADLLTQTKTGKVLVRILQMESIKVFRRFITSLTGIMLVLRLPGLLLHLPQHSTAW